MAKKLIFFPKYLVRKTFKNPDFFPKYLVRKTFKNPDFFFQKYLVRKTFKNPDFFQKDFKEKLSRILIFLTSDIVSEGTTGPILTILDVLESFEIT